MDEEQIAFLRFVDERGVVRWGDIRSLTDMPSGTVAGLIMSGHLTVHNLGDDRELIDQTELSLTDRGHAAIPPPISDLPLGDGLPVSRLQLALF